MELEEGRLLETIKVGTPKAKLAAKSLMKGFIPQLGVKAGWLPFGKRAAKIAFNLYQTHGLSIRIFLKVLEEEFTGVVYPKEYQKDIREEFEKLCQKHAEKSRVASSGMFKGGLADSSEQVTKFHTATHLLHQALRDVLGEHVHQVGSNITAERLRFDFTHPEKLTEEQIKKVEKIVNQKIKEDLPVKMETMTLEEAKKKSALAFFGERYGEKVKVCSIGPSVRTSAELSRMPSGRMYSMEVCGGPHVTSTGKIGNVRIVKEKAVGAGRRRIYAKLS